MKYPKENFKRQNAEANFPEGNLFFKVGIKKCKEYEIIKNSYSNSSDVKTLKNANAASKACCNYMHFALLFGDLRAKEFLSDNFSSGCNAKLISPKK